MVWKEKMIERSTYEEVIEWLERHEGKFPRSDIYKNGERLKKIQMTEEERSETKLGRRWVNTIEHDILQRYKRKEIERIPEEYKQKIEKLISYGYGFKKPVYEEVIEWIETHEGKMPRGSISKNGKRLMTEEMTDQERAERNLYARWLKTKEYKILQKYKRKEIEEVPEEYREKIIELRKYGIGLQKEVKRSVYEEIVEWLETHEGKMPRGIIYRNGEFLKFKQMTEEEKREVNLCKSWYRTVECQMFIEYKEKGIGEIPKEYRNKIQKIRELIQEGKDYKIIKNMKKTVGENVENNEKTRQELNNQIAKKIENKKSRGE